MRSIREIFQKQKKNHTSVPDEKTILYITRNIILKEYGNAGIQNITPLFFQEGRLSIATKSSLWKSECGLYRESLMDAINKECGGEIIQEIFLKTE